MIQVGDKVKLKEDFKQQLINNGCGDHVEEFGNCEGIVTDFTFNDEDVDVRWIPSNLRYGYLVINLEKV